MDSVYEFIRSLWVVWLVLLFGAIVTYALWPGNRRKFRHAARIPLKDDEELTTDDPGQMPKPEPDRPGSKGAKDRD